MFSLLDRLEGWQLLLVLAPVMIIMTVIRKREESAASIKWTGLNSLQKGWVFQSMLAPGLGAKLLTLLSPEERDRLISAGSELVGSPRKVALPAMDLFFKASDQKSLPGKDADEVSRWVNLRFEGSPEELVGLYRKAYL